LETLGENIRGEEEDFRRFGGSLVDFGESALLLLPPGVVWWLVVFRFGAGAAHDVGVEARFAAGSGFAGWIPGGGQ
jgi:hypothetical protein